jgi:hypothetical protein
MDPQATSLERAYQLARSNEFASHEDIRVQLRREGLNPIMSSSPVLHRQLRALMCEARPFERPGLRK